jgi:methylamine dehydrogenase accessory protein MauD
MNSMMLVSYFALWGLVLLLVFAFAVLARQIGFLHQRLEPSGARMTNVGPEIGELIPARTITDIAGRKIELGGVSAKPTLVTFMAATCPSCADLAPALRALWKHERKKVNFLVVAVTGDEEINQRFIAHYDIQDIPYVVSPDLGKDYKVLNPPYGVFLDNAGVVKAKGIVNRLEHLESLLNAAELNEPSLDGFMKKRSVDPAMKPMLGTSE